MAHAPPSLLGKRKLAPLILTGSSTSFGTRAKQSFDWVRSHSPLPHGEPVSESHEEAAPGFEALDAAQNAPPSPPPPPSSLDRGAMLAPYLGLRARLALSLLSPALLSLIFTATHLLISSGSLDKSLASAKQDLIALCTDAEREASVVANLPRYMATSINTRTEIMVTSTVQGIGRVLSLGVEAVEKILVFLADAYRSLFLCLIELLVRGTLAVLIAAVALMNTAVQDAASGIKTAIESSVSAVNSFLSTTISGLNDVLSIVGKSISTVTVAQPDLSALNNVTLPTTFEDALIALNSTLPTLNDFKQKMNDLIELPFETLRQEINNTMSAFQFNTSVLPTPAVRAVTFCNELDTSPLDRFGHTLKILVWILLGLLGLICLALLAFNLMRAWWGWNRLLRHLDLTREAWQDIVVYPPPAIGTKAPYQPETEDGLKASSFPAEAYRGGIYDEKAGDFAQSPLPLDAGQSSAYAHVNCFSDAVHSPQLSPGTRRRRGASGNSPTISSMPKNVPVAHDTMPTAATPLSLFMSRHNLLSLVTVSEHPLLTAWALRGAKRVGLIRRRNDARAQASLRWWVAFTCHPMALVFLGIGLFGLACVQVQLWALTPVEKHYSGQLTQSLNAFTDLALARIDAVTLNASESFANSSNTVITASQDELNGHLFAWVNTTTSTMNTSVNTLMTDLQNVLNDTFAATPLYTPLQTFLTCLVFSKLTNIEEALTWIHDNAKADFSGLLLAPDVLVLGDNSTRELLALGAGEGTNSSTSSDSKGFIQSVTEDYRERLQAERWMFVAFLALYVLVFVVGTTIAALSFYGARTGRPLPRSGIVAAGGP